MAYFWAWHSELQELSETRTILWLKKYSLLSTNYSEREFEDKSNEMIKLAMSLWKGIYAESPVNCVHRFRNINEISISKKTIETTSVWLHTPRYLIHTKKKMDRYSKQFRAYRRMNEKLGCNLVAQTVADTLIFKPRRQRARGRQQGSGARERERWGNVNLPGCVVTWNRIKAKGIIVQVEGLYMQVDHRCLVRREKGR